MIAFDTLKLNIPTGYISFNTSAFEHTCTAKDDKLVVDRYDLVRDRMIPGLNAVRIDNRKAMFELSISAKILGSDYLRGISLNTIEQAVDRINRSKVCELSAVGDWMTDSKVLYVDAVTNIDLGSVGGKSDILACLATLTTNYRKDISPKRPIHAPVQTVLFTQSAKGRGRNAQRHYDKFAELKENKLFLKTLSDKSKLLSCCVNLVRVESTEHTFKGMRQNYGIADNTLSNMLHSAKNVNYERFVRIQGTSVQRELFELFDSVDAAVEAGMKRYDYEKLMGRYSIAKMANYDTEVIRQYLIKFGDSNVRRTLKEYIRMIDDMKRNGMLLGTAKGHEAILRRYTDMLAAA